MKKTITFIFLLISLITLSFRDVITDYLSVPGPVSFNKESYLLAWSHSDKSYYKQEYIRTNDTLEKFNKMIIIDVLQSDLTPKDLVAAKVQEIEKRKTTDSVANYQVFDNPKTGEYLLDFLMSEGDLYEWNVYRYKSINTNKGKAVLLFAYSLRSFEGSQLDLDSFFPYLKKNRMTLINAVGNYKLPLITIKE